MKKMIWVYVVLGIVVALGILSFTVVSNTKVDDTSVYQSDTYENENYVKYVSYDNIVKDKSKLKGLFKLYYDKYIAYLAPNNKNIYIVATKDITDDQLLYGYSVLYNYLNADNGYDMSAVANQIANSNSYLVMVGGSDGAATIPTFAITGQPLYFSEVAVPGSDWFMSNNYEHRDATFEEILHFTHDYGIGIESSPGALPEYQSRIFDATNNALPADKSKWGYEGLWARSVGDRNQRDWLLELEQEGSLEQEYLASVIDSYYGLWGAFDEAPGGMWGMYVAKTREEISSLDPMGYSLLDYFNPYMSSMISLDANFSGDFHLTYDESLPYTYKSQYYKYIRINGSNEVNVYGNSQDNIFIGNNNINIFDGISGFNVVQYDDSSTNYVIDMEGEHITVTNIETNVTDILYHIDVVRFMDLDYKV